MIDVHPTIRWLLALALDQGLPYFAEARVGRAVERLSRLQRHR